MDLFYVFIGLTILLFAGDALVRGAVESSLRLGIPAFIVSLTIVAFGTSAPELLIAVNAALDGVPALALGNVVGSNTANILLVLGVPAIISGINTQTCNTTHNYIYMLAASVFFIMLAFMGPFGIWHGLVLLFVLGMILYQALRTASHSRAAIRACEEELIDTHMRWWKILLFLLVGLVGLPIGADLLVEGAKSIARDFGLDEAVIGLTLVAVGTSLPELATTVAAAMRKQADVALGNVIGSNMFNLLAIMGVASFFAPLPVPREFLTMDLWIMLAATLALAPFAVWKVNLTRAWGVAFVVVYLVYITTLLA
jgi:cation:H+ antiporter